MIKIVHAQSDTFITVAAKRGHLDITKLLEESGADIHVQDDNPIRLAAQNGSHDMSKIKLYR